MELLARILGWWWVEDGLDSSLWPSFQPGRGPLTGEPHRAEHHITSLYHEASTYCLILGVKHYCLVPQARTLVTSLDTFYFLICIQMHDLACLLHKLSPASTPGSVIFINLCLASRACSWVQLQLSPHLVPSLLETRDLSKDESDLDLHCITFSHLHDHKWPSATSQESHSSALPKALISSSQMWHEL